MLDQLLRDDRNEEALALTEEPQKDDGSLVLGLLMGRTLALYRLGQQEAAEAALAWLPSGSVAVPYADARPVAHHARGAGLVSQPPLSYSLTVFSCLPR